jgi:catechol-2,3-dioxygenase
MDTHADKLHVAGKKRTFDTTPVSPSLFAHFVLRTPQRAPLRDWYIKVLNARLVFENDYISFITYDDEHHRVAFVQIPDLEKPAEKAWGLAHVAYTLADLGQLLGTYRRLKADGIVPVRTINHGPTVSMYYRDPDGNQVELQVDAFDKAGAASYFHTEPFAKNPIGVLFDPERMAADYEAGMPEAELLRRP